MDSIATDAASQLLSSGDIAITALMFLGGVLLWLLISEKRDHKSTRSDLKEANSDVRSLSERALTAIAGLRESINDFIRRQ